MVTCIDLHAFRRLVKSLTALLIVPYQLQSGFQLGDRLWLRLQFVIPFQHGPPHVIVKGVEVWEIWWPMDHNFCGNQPSLWWWRCKVETPDRVVDLFAVFVYTSIIIGFYRPITIFQISSFREPLISTTVSRCRGNFMNLAAIIVAFWPSEYDSKLRLDFQTTISEVTLNVFKIL